MKKSKVKSKSKSKSKLKSKGKFLRLFVQEGSGIKLVKLNPKYQKSFINKFGLEQIPTLEDFNQFKDSM